MKRKTYRGETMKQARLKVKRDLGTDAKILETRKVREGGFFGFFTDTKVEVDACLPPDRNRTSTGRRTASNGRSGSAAARRTRSEVATKTKNGSRNGGSSNGNFERSVNEPVEPKVSPREQATQLIKEHENGNTVSEQTYTRPKPNGNSGEEPSRRNGSGETDENENDNDNGGVSEEKIRQVLENTDRLSEKLDQLADSVEGSEQQVEENPGENYPGELSSLFSELLDAGVERKYARDLVGRAQRTLEADKLDRRDAVEGELQSLIEDDLDVADPLRTDRDETLLIPFVGPTGVGKTTTMAKLAAHFSVEESQSVSFITFDTYRLAAVEQLRCYADILQVPIEAVMSEEEFKETVEEFEAESDIIFIDTAGRSQFDHEKISELEGMLDDTREIVTHLVVDATSRTEDLDSIFEGFEPIDYDRLVITKLDETRRHGTIYNVSRRSDQPIAYFTDGQDVPDDLRMMEPDELSDLLLSDQNSLTVVGESDQ